MIRNFDHKNEHRSRTCETFLREDPKQMLLRTAEIVSSLHDALMSACLENLASMSAPQLSYTKEIGINSTLHLFIQL